MHHVGRFQLQEDNMRIGLAADGHVHLVGRDEVVLGVIEHPPELMPDHADRQRPLRRRRAAHEDHRPRYHQEDDEHDQQGEDRPRQF